MRLLSGGMEIKFARFDSDPYLGSSIAMAIGLIRLAGQVSSRPDTCRVQGVFVAQKGNGPCRCRRPPSRLAPALAWRYPAMTALLV